MSKKSIYDKFGTDKKAEQEGVILDYGDGLRIRIARAGGSNIRFEKTVQTKMRRFGLQAKHDLLDPDQMREVMREVMAETVVLGWEGVTDRDGNPLAFNRENCIQVFKDLPDLFEDVLEQSRKASLFKANILEDEAGN
jgi:hypothetical protein